MWQLIINGPGYFDTTYDLPEGETSLGRADENDIVLSGDLVSRKHARIKVKGDHLTVEDLGSRNGSKVNGQPLTTVVDLKAGDTVNVGENTLSIRRPAKVENAATEMVDLGAGGVRRFGVEGEDIAQAVMIAKNVRESVVLQALDNILPFDHPPPSPLLDDREQPGGTAASGPAIGYENLVVLYKTAEALAKARTLPGFLEETLDRLISRMAATTAVVLLRHHSGVMVPAAVRHRGKLEKGEVPVSDAIISEALTKGAALVVGDVREDRRFNTRESVLMYGVDQVICVPIGEKEPFGGVLYLNRKMGDSGSLEPLLDLAAAVAHLIAAGVAKFQTASGGRDEERLRGLYERFLPPEILERRVEDLVRAGGSALGTLEEKTVTVLVADIAGFSAVLPKLAPEVVKEILTDLYQRATGVIFSFGGTVDKFLGDGVVALFGAPYNRGDDALRAVRCALAMRADWARAMAKLAPGTRCELKIGLHTGKVLAGALGSESRLDYTAVGEAVNVAAWLCGSGQPAQILITGKTLATIGARFDVTPLGERVLRAGREKVACFEVLEEDTGGQFTTPGAA